MAARVATSSQARVKISPVGEYTSGESSTAYYVTNHGETAPESSLTSAIEAQNITLTSLDMLAKVVPEDCDWLFMLDPQISLMAAAPLAFRVHAVAGMILFMVWPFTRLVHAFSAPVGYVARPYIVYRDRGPHDAGNRQPRPGWEKVGGP